MTVPVVIYTRKDFFLVDAFNDKIDSIKAAGLVDRWHAQSFNSKLLNDKELEFHEALNLQHLSGCFQILIIGSILSAFVFLLEISPARARSF